jgi:hypothetical protein
MMTSTILGIPWMVVVVIIEASHFLLTVALLQTPLACVNLPKVLLAKIIITNVPVKRRPGYFRGILRCTLDAEE